MKALFVKAMLWLTRMTGGWFLRTAAWFISSGYFLFRRARVSAGMDLYRAVFPNKSEFFYLGCVWKQFKNFSSCYGDRVALDKGMDVDYVEEGGRYLEEAVARGRGGILLMSHLGNWEIAARLFRRKGLRMLLLMGERDPRMVARFQREDMKAEGLDVMVSAPGDDSPFAGLEAVQFIEDGGFLAIAGDISWADAQRGQEVSLFGRRVVVPGAPHLLALLSGAPVFSFFSFRRKGKPYLFVITRPWHVRASTRAERKKAMRESAERYARELERAILRFPFQWYVFEPFLGEPAGNASSLQRPPASNS